MKPAGGCGVVRFWWVSFFLSMHSLNEKHVKNQEIDRILRSKPPHLVIIWSRICGY